MSEALTRANTYIEDLIGWLPGPAQGVVQRVISPVTELLYELTGDPNDLMRAAQVWADSSADVDRLAAETDQDVSTMLASWEGEASAAFAQLMQQVTDSMRELVDGVRGTADILVEAANAAVEAFNLILQLIGEFILWAGAAWLLALASAVFSFGASIAAATTATIARAVGAVGRGTAIAARFVAILTRLTAVLQRIAEILMAYRKAILALKVLKTSTGRLSYMVIKAITLAPGKIVFNTISPINIPGAIGTGQDVYGGYQDLQDGSVDGDYLIDAGQGR